jgi:hypothetical protein
VLLRPSRFLTERHRELTLVNIESMTWLTLLGSSCGPQVADDHDDAAGAATDTTVMEP